TEELWHATVSTPRTEDLILAAWPTGLDALVDEKARDDIDWLIRLVTEIRSVRTEMNIPPAARVQLLAQGGAETAERLARHDGILKRLARLEEIGATADAPKGAVQMVVEDATFYLPLAGVIDIAQERARLQKNLEKLRGEIRAIEGRLANENFPAKAPPAVIAENRARRDEAAET